MISLVPKRVSFTQEWEGISLFPSATMRIQTADQNCHVNFMYLKTDGMYIEFFSHSDVWDYILTAVSEK